MAQKIKLDPPVKFIPRGPHHLYIGLVLIVFGWLMAPYDYYQVWSNIFYIVGALIMADDIIEHTITGSTPLRIFFDKILFPFMKYINNLIIKK